MEAIILAGARPSARDAAGGPPEGARRGCGQDRWGPTRWRLAKAGVTRVIFAVFAAGRGAVRTEARRHRAGDRVRGRSPSGSSRRRHQGSRGPAPGERRRARTHGRRARRRRFRELARGTPLPGGALATIHRPRSRSRSSDLLDVDDDDVVHAFVRAARPVLGELRQLRPVGGAIERFPDPGDHESSTFPGSPPRAACARFATRPLAHGQHAERAGATASEHVGSHPECCREGSSSRWSMNSPNLTRSTTVLEVKKVEKPWGTS